MKNRSVVICLLYNIIAIGCWATLAVLFGKWWIALFSVLFLIYPKYVNKYYRICDKCGKHSAHANSYNDALAEAKKQGWSHNVADNTDYCPDCQKDL